MTINRILDALCWTPLARPIRSIRMHRINKISKEIHDRRKIDLLINSIVSKHGDLLS